MAESVVVLPKTLEYEPGHSHCTLNTTQEMNDLMACGDKVLSDDRALNEKCVGKATVSEVQISQKCHCGDFNARCSWTNVANLDYFLQRQQPKILRTSSLR